MSLSGFILNRVASLLTLHRTQQPRRNASDPRILVIRRNRMGDMIYTLPLLHTLRRHFPKAHISVACDPPGEPIALACPAVNDVIVLAHGWNPIQASFKNAWHLQNYDWVIAAKGGYDSRLARLVRLTNAAIRIGFVRDIKQPSPHYTDPVALPAESEEEHQIETLLRLLQPLGLAKVTAFAVNLTLEVPVSARAFAEEIFSKPPFTTSSHYMLINISSTAKLKFREEDFISLSKRILNLTDLAIGLVAAPQDQQKAREIAMCMGSKRIDAIETPGAMELAALIEEADFLLTPEGGAAHLAAAMKRPALVMWSEGPFVKWRSRHERHAFVQPFPHEETIPLERVWDAMQPFLAMKKGDVEETFGETLDSGEFDHMEDS